MCMRTSPTCTYDPPDLNISAWITNFWLIDANTRVFSPQLTSNIGVIKPNSNIAILETNVTIEAEDKKLSASIALVIMDPYEPQALMRFIASTF